MRISKIFNAASSFKITKSIMENKQTCNEEISVSIINLGNQNKQTLNNTTEYKSNSLQPENIQQSVRFHKFGSENILKCVYFNARSIASKIKELELLVINEGIDIVGITETWLNSNISDTEMGIDGYTLLRKDRNDNKRGGGVALYIKNDISFVCCEGLLEKYFPETLFCTINCGREKTLLVICYRPPCSLVGNDCII